MAGGDRYEDGALAAQWQSVPKLVVKNPYIDVLNEPKVQGGDARTLHGDKGL